MPIVVETPRHEPCEVDPARPLRLLAVGRIVPANGIGVLVRSARVALDAGALDFTLDVLGASMSTTSDYCAQVEALIADLDLDDVVTLRLDASDNDLRAAYAGAHVLVTASKHEGSLDAGDTRRIEQAAGSWRRQAATWR
jgi:glycosyltransferase involved in cell wall biosynthesis